MKKRRGEGNAQHWRASKVQCGRAHGAQSSRQSSASCPAIPSLQPQITVAKPALTPCPLSQAAAEAPPSRMSSVIRRSQRALTSSFETLRFLASAAGGGKARHSRPRPAVAPSRAPPPPQSTALQEQQQTAPAPAEQWPPAQQQQPQRVVAEGTSLLGLVGVGAGVGLVFALLSRIF